MEASTVATEKLTDEERLEKKRAANRAYAKAHSAERKAWKAANRAKVNAAERERHRRNPGYFQRHYAANAERIKARVKASTAANPGPSRLRAKEQAQKNPER